MIIWILVLFLLEQGILVWPRNYVGDKALKAMYDVLKIGRMYKLLIKCLIDYLIKWLNPSCYMVVKCGALVTMIF
jgi:hypothetical protein